MRSGRERWPGEADPETAPPADAAGPADPRPAEAPQAQANPAPTTIPTFTPPSTPATPPPGAFARPPSAVAQRSAAQHARFATRFAGQLLTAGAVLTIVLSVTLGLNDGAYSAGWFAVYGDSVVALVGGLTLMAMRRPAPEWVLIATPSLAALLITVAMVVDRSSALSGMVLLTWPVLFAGYLLPRRSAWWTLAVVLVCLALVVASGRGKNRMANYVELATSVTLTLIVIQRLRGQADRLREALAEQARTDDLTGLANRRAFTEALDREYARFRRYRRPLSLLAVDVDHFKLVNDTWGHAAGDAALRRLGLLLTNHVRASDVVGRMGGEEFAVLMPDCGAQQAACRAESLRAAVHDRSPAWEHPITVSIGVATIPDSATTPEQLQDAADAALYGAKGAGRDRVHTAAEHPAE